MTMQGKVLKNYNGYYYVAAGGVVYTCKVRGKMKLNRFSLVSGDEVAFTADEGKLEGMITSVLPRKNFMLRPAVANIDLMVITLACATPDFSFLLADKLLALARFANIPAVLTVNKSDLARPGLLEEISAVYGGAGYEVFPVSAASGDGVEALRKRLRGKICVFGGPSGAGKSSLLNAVDPDAALTTGSVSEKIGRGRHTTRYTQLLPFDGGYIADTPGFGNIFLGELDKERLSKCFQEFAAYEAGCRFCPCTHTHEPVCGVKTAAAEGKIAPSRYESYLAVLEEIREIQEREGRR